MATTRCASLLPRVSASWRFADESATRPPKDSIFRSLVEASDFFAGGSVGYSPSRRADRLDGLKLASEIWRVEPFEMGEVHSQWLEDSGMLPQGSAVYDCTLPMRNIPHEWHAVAPVTCGACA